MSSRERIAPSVRATPAPPERAPSRPPALHPDLLRDASRRVVVASLLSAVLWVVGVGTAYLNETWFHLRIPASQFMLLTVGAPAFAIGGASVLVSVALFVYAHTGKRDPQHILDLGVGYLLLMALALSLIFHVGQSPTATMLSPAISWVGAVILTFAAILPSSPRRTLVLGLVAASMNPLVMIAVDSGAGAGSGRVGRALTTHYPDYILVAIAVVISHVVTRLGRQLSKAREMGSYQLGALLGRGGMGEVYQAKHRMLKRPAAIKLIRPERLGEGGDAAKLVVARFRREAEAAASLRSAHTVALYDFGVSDDETLFFVMELLEGMDLETLVRANGPLPAARAIHILRQACESLEEAHARGLVHRDIKPANIHVGRIGLRHDFVKVLDFGLVKSVARASDPQSLETAVGMTPGTPAYMAPEMALNEEVDSRADIYALGAVAFFVLTGRQVFEATTNIQMIAKHLQDEPPPPSQLAGVPVPPALDRLVLSCLAKRPADRPPSAAALDRALAAIAVEPWTEEQAMRWWTTNLGAAATEMSSDRRAPHTERVVRAISGQDPEGVAARDTTAD